MTQARAFEPLHLESLEPRTLFSQFGYQSAAEFLGLTQVVHDLAPEGAVGFGACVAGLGDIDNDGVPDFAVGASGRAGENAVQGEVFLYSGASGSFIRSLSDGVAGFGNSLANIGDVNNDGVPDLLVGSEQWDSDPDSASPAGRAYVYSGADGSLVRMLDAPGGERAFGHVVLGAPDLNDDGVPDMVVSAPGVSSNDNGRVFVLSGADGAVIRTLTSNGVTGDGFGEAVSVLHIPGTPANDTLIAVGAPRYYITLQSGHVEVFNGAGERLHFFTGTESREEYGSAVAIYTITPFEGGPPAVYLTIGAPGDDGIAPFEYHLDRGSINVERLDPPGGGPNFLAASEYARTGERIFNLGDIDGQGGDDLAILAPGALPSERTRLRLNGIDGDPDSSTVNLSINSVSMATIGDVDGDGIPDVLVGDGAGHAIVVSSVALADQLSASRITVIGSTEDMSYVWFDIGATKYLRVPDGSIVPFSNIEGLLAAPPRQPDQLRSTIVGVTPDGGLVFYNDSYQLPRRGALQVTLNGIVTSLENMVQTIEGGETPDYDRFQLVEINGNGTWIINESADDPADTRAWAFSDGTLSLLWSGIVLDINAADQIVGLRHQFTDAEESLFLDSDGTVTVLAGIENVGAINDDGVVLGVLPGTRTLTNPGNLATWRDGVVTDLGPSPGLPNQSPPDSRWYFLAFDDTGRALASASWTPVRAGTQYDLYLIEPGQAPEPLAPLVHGRPDVKAFGSAGLPADNYRPALFHSAGAIFVQDAALTPISDADLVRARDDSPVANLTTPGGSFVAFVNRFNEFILRSNTGNGWNSQVVATDVNRVDPLHFVMYTDPMDEDRAYLAFSYAGELRVSLLEHPSNFTAINHWSDQTAITGGLATFTNAEGVVHLVGTDLSGDVVIYFRSLEVSPLDPAAWTYNNLTSTHLVPQGFATPAFVGDFTAFATPWHGMAINGLDTAGNVYSIWWAPGRVPWSIANLTEAADAGPLTGQIVSFCTPWGTQHVNGVDENGDVVAIWWAPGFGGAWREDELVAEGIALDPSSLTSYIAPWGGLNIAGRDAETDQVVVYWWSPESDVWRDERLAFRGDAPSPALRGRLSSDVSPDGTMSIGVAGAEDDVLRFSWRPGDAGQWTLEDLTELAS